MATGGSEKLVNHIAAAWAEFNSVCSDIYPRKVTFVDFDRADDKGYWFKFLLDGDPQEKLYCVMHGDLETCNEVLL